MALAFPKMFYKNSTKVLEGPEGTKNDLVLILNCEKGEQLGDPYFGVNLHKTKFKTNSVLAKELVIDSILEAQEFINTVLFFREDVKVVKNSIASLDITIEAVFSQAVNAKELIIIQGLEVDS